LEGTPDERLLIATHLNQHQLGADLLARFAGAKLRQPDVWELLRAAFRASSLDPRLAGQHWLAELLLQNAPPDGYPPVAAGVLDADTAWRQALGGAIRLDTLRPDAEALLRWSLEPVNLSHYEALRPELRERLADRLRATGGPAVDLALGAINAGRGADAVALGLCLGTLFADEPTEPALRDAAIRLESAFGGRRIVPTAARALATAAERVVSDPELASQTLACHDRANAILSELQIAYAAGRSSILKAGFDKRLQACAAAILAALDRPEQASSEVLHRAIERASQHHEAASQPSRVERLKMAARLLRWLATPESPPKSFAAAAADYVTEGGWVDLARTAVHAGDPVAELAAALDHIAAACRSRRERENECFADLLARWNERGGGDILPIEAVIERVVAPLASAAPVLLLVLDGLSYGVFRALEPELERAGWIPVAPEAGGSLPPVIAAIPSVTEVCRTSLLCGTLRRGDSTLEKRGFANIPALATARRRGRRPVLFHRAELGWQGGVPGELARCLEDSDQRVIGIVHNAVDSQLSGADQLALDWRLGMLRQLLPILRLARSAGRSVVITGDQGHMLDRGTRMMAGEGGDRWRRGDRAGSGEVRISGGRVVPPDQSFILAWSEGIRYADKRAGYHGGVSAQEMVVPLAIFGPGTVPAGWTSVAARWPLWWPREQGIVSAGQRRPPPLVNLGRREITGEPDLFSTELTASC
jgi:hypothetical protein